MQYPSVLNKLKNRINKNDVLVIGDVNISSVFVLDTRGMGLNAPIPVGLRFRNIMNILDKYVTQPFMSIPGKIVKGAKGMLGIKEANTNSIKITKKELKSLIIKEMARHYYPKGVKNPSAENRKTGMTLGALAGSFYPAPYALGVLAGAVAGYFSGDLINLKRGYEEGKIYEQHPLHIVNIRKNCDITNAASIEKYIKDNGGIDEIGRPRVKYNIIDFNLFGKVSPEDKKLLLVMKSLGLFETKMQTAKSKLPFIGDK